MPAKLSVNLNAIAMLRNRRDLPWPSVDRARPHRACRRRAWADGASAARRAAYAAFRPAGNAGADRRRISRGAEFNIEGYPTEDFLALVEKHQPDQVTLVPDDPAQATSDHGWDFAGRGRVPDADRQAPEKGRFPRLAVCRPRSGRHRTPRATPAPTASSSTRAPTAPAMIRFRQGRQGTGKAGKNRRCRARRRACGQCRPRSDGHQSAGTGTAHPRPCGSVDRTWLDSRRAGVWHGRNGRGGSSRRADGERSG